jgi:hypothetical protein
MKKILKLIVLIVAFAACDSENNPEKDPCSVLVDGVYQYPNKKPDAKLTQDEIKEYWDIPKDVLTCIGTKGLILSCYNSNANIIISASNGYQGGYGLVKYWCRGFDELEKREDFGEAFIQYYKSLELPHTIDYSLFTLEIAMSQENVLKHLTKEQQIELLNQCLNYHLERRVIFNTTEIHYEGTPVIMGRLMVADGMEQFILSTKRNNDILRFLDGTETYRLSIANADTIVNYAVLYLNKLKSTN